MEQSPPQKLIQHLTDTCFGQSSGLNQTRYTKDIVMRQSVEEWNPDWMSVGKIAVAIHQFQNKKLPGPDGLRPIVLKNLPKSCLEHLLFIFKTCLLLSFTPTRWKGSRVVFIPKPGKSNYKAAKSWRPISLTNYILKTLERLSLIHI